MAKGRTAEDREVGDDRGSSRLWPVACGLWPVGVGWVVSERRRKIFSVACSKGPLDIYPLAVVVLAWCLFLLQLRMRLARFLCTHYTASRSNCTGDIHTTIITNPPHASSVRRSELKKDRMRLNSKINRKRFKPQFPSFYLYTTERNLTSIQHASRTRKK